MNISKRICAALALVVGGVAFPNTAEAADDPKPGVLEGKPIVVNKIELRRMRAQITPRGTMTLSQPFYHQGMVGAKVQFDFFDWLGARAAFDLSILPVQSKLLRATRSSLPEGKVFTDTKDGVGPIRTAEERDNAAPLLHDFEAGLTSLQLSGSAGIVFTPFAGKLGMFQSIFTEYDLYVWGGYGMTQWASPFKTRTESTEEHNNGCVKPDGSDLDECIIHPVIRDEGTKWGPAFGAGFHLFVTDWLAINPEVEDIVIKHNLTGLNATITDIPIRVDGDDQVVVHNANFSLGVTIYIPFKAKRTKLRP